MKNMKMLRLLCMHNGDEKNKTTSSFSSDSNCHDDSIEYLPNNLRLFAWPLYPWKLLPENFNPKRLVHLDLRWNSLHYLWNETKQQFQSLRSINLMGSKSLKRTPDFEGLPNLEYLNLEECTSLEEVNPSLKYCKKLTQLYLFYCTTLERFPYVNVESLESLDLHKCCSLEKFPEILGRMKPELEIEISFSGIREIPSSIIQQYSCHLTVLILSDMKKLESLPEEIGDLENLEELDARYTLISRPLYSIVRLNKLKSLTFEKHKSEDRVNFVFPPVSEGLRSLEKLDLSYCNIKDGGLPEDIGSLSSLKELNLRGNNFEHLPHSIAQLGALRILDLSHCMRLIQLPEFPQQLNTIAADWSNDSICNLLFQNISSLQHDICTSDFLSLRVFTTKEDNIPRWFHHRENGKSIFVKLPKNWYVSENFLGFAVCFSSQFIDGIAHLFCYHGRPVMCIAQKLALSTSSPSEYRYKPAINFFLVPLTGLLDKLKANGKTPNDYGCIKLTFSKEVKECGLCLLYKHHDHHENHDSVTRCCRIL